MKNDEIMKMLTDEDFLQKLKNFVLWQVFHRTKGEYINFAKYELNKDQSYVIDRVYIELSLRHIGSPTAEKDGIREIVNKIIAQENQLMYGAK